MVSGVQFNYTDGAVSYQFDNLTNAESASLEACNGDSAAIQAWVAANAIITKVVNWPYASSHS